MPPKVKVTKEEIVSACIDIVRQQGMDALNARNIASNLGCSTQPVYSNFSTMDQLRSDLLKRARQIYDENARSVAAEGKYHPYKASGMAYISFARNEKELFKLLFMRKRSNMDEDLGDDLLGLFSVTVKMASDTTGIESARAEQFHFEIWAFVHGIASMLATGYLDLDEETISSMVTDAFMGLKMRFGVNSNEYN